MKIDIQKIKKQLGFPSDRPLTLQEKRRYMKFAVYPLFFLIFAGIVLLIYSPTEKEKAEAEKERGFNTEIPSPEESRMEGNKVSAYEREALSKKERGRKDTFLEMSELFNRNKDRKDTVPSVDSGVNLELPSVPETVQTHNPVRSSTSAYHDMNRSLTTIYTPRETSREEELLRRIEELEKRQNMEPSQEQSLEEKMALMEKSYELAARYNGKQTPSVIPTDDRKDRTSVKPVKRIRQEVVSSLAQPVNDGDFIAGALASLPPNERVMKDKPRRSGKDGDFIITRPMAYNIFGVGFAFVVILMGLLFYFHAQDGLTPHDLSWFFSFFVMLQFWNMFNAKAFMEGRSAFANLKDSKSFLLVALLILIGQYLIVTFGGEMFSVIPLSLRDWVIIIGSSSLVLWIGELFRLSKR